MTYSVSDRVNSVLILLVEKEIIENSDSARHEAQYILRMDD